MQRPSNGKVPGTFVSQDELNDLGKLLHTLRDYIVSHEARIELIEGWINEYMEAHAPVSEAPEEAETSGITLAQAPASEEEIAAFLGEGGVASEPTDDPEEG